MNDGRDLAFSRTEYDRRLRALRASAAGQGLDAMLFFSPGAVCYLGGFSSVNLWDVVCLVVTAEGDPLLIFRQFELDRFRASSRYEAHAPYPPGGTALPTLIEQVSAIPRGSGRVGIELGRYVDTSLWSGLRAGLPDIEFTDCSALLDPVRLTKSDEEIAVMRRAAKVTDEGVLAGRRAIREGVSDYEVCADVTRALLAGGSDFMCIQPIVAAGERSGIAHSTAAGITVGDGDPVFLELGACIHRYTAPIMRTVFAGRPGAELRELADYSSRALDRMIEVIRPGLPASEVAAAGHKALSPILSKIAFHFVWGYPVGVGFPPSWLEETGFFLEAGNHRELEAGMIFHLPLMLRVAGRYGAGHSETVLVTPTGAEVMSALER